MSSSFLSSFAGGAVGGALGAGVIAPVVTRALNGNSSAPYAPGFVPVTPYYAAMPRRYPLTLHRTYTQPTVYYSAPQPVYYAQPQMVMQQPVAPPVYMQPQVQPVQPSVVCRTTRAPQDTSAAPMGGVSAGYGLNDDVMRFNDPYRNMGRSVNVQTASFGQPNYAMTNPIAYRTGNIAGGLGEGVGGLFGGLFGGISRFFSGIGDGFRSSYAAATTRQPAYAYPMQAQPMRVAANENVVCRTVKAPRIKAPVAAAPTINCACVGA